VARKKLTRTEQRYNYGVAVFVVAMVGLLVIVSPHVIVDGTDVPVLVLALLVGGFLFGLGQMIIGISRRRRYLRSLADAEESTPA
jgi:hypothetical protein